MKKWITKFTKEAQRARRRKFWGAKEGYCIMQGEDKVGIWKCPYHNGRACLELLKRIPENGEVA